jgi:hypothetical protein
MIGILGSRVLGLTAAPMGRSGRSLPQPEHQRKIKSAVSNTPTIEPLVAKTQNVTLRAGRVRYWFAPPLLGRELGVR